MNLNFSTDVNKFVNNKRYIGTNKEILYQYKRYRNDAVLKEEIILKIDMINLIIGILLTILGILGLIFSTPPLVFLIVISATLLIGYFVKKRRWSHFKQLTDKIEKEDNSIYSYIQTSSHSLSDTFFEFLGNSSQEFRIYILTEESFKTPLIPKSMIFMWEYLFEWDGKYYQLAIGKDKSKKIDTYIVFEIDDKTGFIKDENIQTVFLNRDERKQDP